MRYVAAVLVFAAISAGMWMQSSAGAAPRPCVKVCRMDARLMPGRPITWASPQRFAAHYPLVVFAYIDGRKLTMLEGVHDCWMRYYGHGAVVATGGCGKSSPLRVEATAIRPVRLTIRYYLDPDAR